MSLYRKKEESPAVLAPTFPVLVQDRDPVVLPRKNHRKHTTFTVFGSIQSVAAI
jgi:hypothetical protein